MAQVCMTKLMILYSGKLQWPGGGIRMVSENFKKIFLTFLGLGTNVVKVSSVNSELLFQSDTLACMYVTFATTPSMAHMDIKVTHCNLSTCLHVWVVQSRMYAYSCERRILTLTQ